MFSKGSQGQGGAIRGSQGRPTEPAASAPALDLLALSPVSGNHFAKASSIWDVRGCTSPLEVSRQMEGRKNEAPGL